MAHLDFISGIHNATERNYVQRVVEYDKAECAIISKKFGQEYFDGDRKYGYGGFRYDGRWKSFAEKLIAHYGLKPGMRVYAVDRLELVNPVFTSGAAFTAPQTYWRAAPYLELSMPLWGGGFGRVSQATEELTRQQNVAEKLGSQAQGLGLLVEAEATYWRLSSAREIVQVQSQALKQAQGILDYVSRKARMNLGENADVLQAKALVEARTFQLQQAHNQERAARRAFNVLLNKPAEAPVESLQSLQYDSIAKTEVPTAKPGDRFDVQAAAAQSQLARSSAVLVAERNKPKVDLYGSYAIDGFDTNYDSASTKSFSAERDSAFVGVRLNMPLYVSAMGDAKAGAEWHRHFSCF